MDIEQVLNKLEQRRNQAEDSATLSDYELGKAAGLEIAINIIKLAQQKYTYSAEWSDEDKIFVARVDEFPLLAAHGGTKEEALEQIHKLVCITLNFKHAFSKLIGDENDEL